MSSGSLHYVDRDDAFITGNMYFEGNLTPINVELINDKIHPHSCDNANESNRKNLIS